MAVRPKDVPRKFHIQTDFSMMNFEYHDVHPLHLHPTSLKSIDLAMIEKRLDINALQGNLVPWKDLSSEKIRPLKFDFRAWSRIKSQSRFEHTLFKHRPH